MEDARAVDVTLGEAIVLIEEELAQAEKSLEAGIVEQALDRFVRALGLALQLGPAPTERVLHTVLRAARQMSQAQDSESLSALGPSLSGLLHQMRSGEALPQTNVMDAWASIVGGLAILITQIGLALTVSSDNRHGMLAYARIQASLLDGATEGVFSLADWVEKLEY